MSLSGRFQSVERYLPTFLNASSVLRQPLGKWVNRSHCQLRWFYSVDTERIYHNEGNNWRVYHKSNASTRSLQRYKYEMTSADISVPLLPTTVINNNPCNSNPFTSNVRTLQRE